MRPDYPYLAGARKPGTGAAAVRPGGAEPGTRIDPASITGQRAVVTTRQPAADDPGFPATFISETGPRVFGSAALSSH